MFTFQPIYWNSSALVQKVYYACSSHQLYIWLSILYGINFLLLIFGTFLAWETRHVNIPALNDSRYIGMSVYNIIILSVVGVIFSQFTTSQLNTGYIVIAILIFFCTTVTMSLVFVPKVNCSAYN